MTLSGRSAGLFAAIAAAACVGPFRPETTLEPTLLVRTASVYNDMFSSETTRLVTTATEWLELWSKMFSNHKPIPDLPQVDFNSSTVVLVASGTKLSGGYSVLITSVKSKGDSLTVSATMETPGGTCVVTGALTSPVAAVSVPGRFSRATFDISRTQRNCG